MHERRGNRRYELSLLVTIRRRVKAKSSARTGMIRNISTGGVYFAIDQSLSVGAELDLTLTLPTEVTGGPEVFIKALGKVLRVDKFSGNQSFGVAAILKRHEIVREVLRSQ